MKTHPAKIHQITEQNIVQLALNLLIKCHVNFETLSLDMTPNRNRIVCREMFYFA